MESCYVAQTSLGLLASSNPPALVSRSAEITGIREDPQDLNSSSQGLLANFKSTGLECSSLTSGHCNLHRPGSSNPATTSSQIPLENFKNLKNYSPQLDGHTGYPNKNKAVLPLFKVEMHLRNIFTGE
ncbi:hypothetical protein AAY473_016419, partial [Plecturocebus cupreus]